MRVLRGWRRFQEGRTPVLGELVVVLALLWAYDWVRSKSHPRVGLAQRNGEDVLRLETRLHIDAEHAANAWVGRHDVLEWVASLWYQSAHICITMGVLGWLWWRHPDRYRVARNALVLINVAGLVIFALYPCMPPRLLPGRHFVDAIEASGLGSSPAGPVPADQYAAMPSLHLAWATWVAVTASLAVGSVVLRRLWRCYPLVTASVVVVTANHYVLDIVAGVAVAAVALPLAARLTPQRAAREGGVRGSGDGPAGRAPARQGAAAPTP
ncbi:PAP2 superfamily protein [Motilibacter rhizosphaerae]|uniref:PAP2 superfamily protein n=1 Tax=Motilibacter rhizosphaerae TaxID=598652 RepID=A0A4Q7NPG3_9ACTN|nr:phosphatase PAP2 family protein [Motilibacter rhizosphaerae]RZS87159.1 PAP2 superfamily protein [Motilibacter rhizosphaerae]